MPLGQSVDLFKFLTILRAFPSRMEIRACQAWAQMCPWTPKPKTHTLWHHEERQVVEGGIFGPLGSPKASQQIRALNRIITWSNEGIWLEPDPIHAELIIKWLGTGQPRKRGTTLRRGSFERRRCSHVNVLIYSTERSVFGAGQT